MLRVNNIGPTGQTQDTYQGMTNKEIEHKIKGAFADLTIACESRQFIPTASTKAEKALIQQALSNTNVVVGNEGFIESIKKFFQKIWDWIKGLFGKKKDKDEADVKALKDDIEKLKKAKSDKVEVTYEKDRISRVCANGSAMMKRKYGSKVSLKLLTDAVDAIKEVNKAGVVKTDGTTDEMFAELPDMSDKDDTVNSYFFYRSGQSVSQDTGALKQTEIDFSDVGVGFDPDDYIKLLEDAIKEINLDKFHDIVKDAKATDEKVKSAKSDDIAELKERAEYLHSITSLLINGQDGCKAHILNCAPVKALKKGD